MAKLAPENLVVEEVLQRMLKKSGLRFMSDLAEDLGVKPQSITQARARASISLPFLMRGAARYQCSMDYLLYGIEDPAAANHDDAYIYVERTSGGTVPILKEVLRIGVDEKKLRTYISGDKLYVIDETDKEITDGLYAFGKASRPAIRQCKVSISGTILVSDEQQPMSAEDLKKLGVVGRVIWSGSAN